MILPGFFPIQSSFDFQISEFRLRLLFCYSFEGLQLHIHIRTARLFTFFCCSLDRVEEDVRPSIHQGLLRPLKGLCCCCVFKMNFQSKPRRALKRRFCLLLLNCLFCERKERSIGAVFERYFHSYSPYSYLQHI